MRFNPRFYANLFSTSWWSFSLPRLSGKMVWTDQETLFGSKGTKNFVNISCIVMSCQGVMMACSVRRWGRPFWEKDLDHRRWHFEQCPRIFATHSLKTVFMRQFLLGWKQWKVMVESSLTIFKSSDVGMKYRMASRSWPPPLSGSCSGRAMDCFCINP
jgi:hypothetical protein